ncbi:spore maturation protein B [Alkalithermobacter thermoalcaliphilus JW-YL-7 = DSM 7308]|uniref:Spore maturation protein B n=1 Tax=Alkalithermobacter thermoalcaliphilus JW-YL-7 = DSM 7308 TaxID=1121328 RepID=A0A150FTX3_CLOPD|nr:spore maturation protein B [[Clostridium] paradoxum JW-YL-7 = DSM 7308]SHL19710.1 spore maturation protein B [[Clostridium] paradoxum JW-YL-7 = DSM 7308]
MNTFSNTVIPLIILIIIIYGKYKGIDVYDSFVKGAYEGIKTAYKIAPYLIGIFLALGIFKEGYGMEILEAILYPILRIFNIPRELISLVIVKPLSGSGSLALYKDIIGRVGIDTVTERMAATILGSSETIFYTMAIYYGSLKIKNIRYTLFCALVSHMAGVLASIFICSIVFR